MTLSSTHGRCAALVLSAIVGGTALSGCNRNDDRTVGQKVDAAIATTERKASEATAETREAGRDLRRAASDATGDARQAANDATRDARQAAEAIGNKSKDVAITAEVKARLVKEPTLSALAINVDTSAGRVVLRGNAPDTASRSRATELARGVDGVVAVDNELNVQPK